MGIFALMVDFLIIHVVRTGDAISQERLNIFPWNKTPQVCIGLFQFSIREWFFLVLTTLFTNAKRGR